MSKSKIFLNVGTYLPGYRGGGPTQSVKNLVEALSGEFDFYIFTANHDLGISQPYDKIDTDQWNKKDDEVNIFYSSDQNKRKNLKQIFIQQNFSLIFLNSFFSSDTIRILILRKQLKIDTPIILMPRGELSKGALNIKVIKKMAYIRLAKLFGLLNGIHYLTTAKDEYRQVQKLLDANEIYEITNIPNTEKRIILNTKEKEKLKVVFLSRITEKKNLDYALKTMKNCKEIICFDIYGTIEEKLYWEKCQKIISTLPNNIIVNYKGELSNEKVVSTLSQYDLFYFPTKSENYGHVISEALQASIPVLISDQTPWKNLEEKKFGWELALEKDKVFSKILDSLSLMGELQYNTWKESIFNNFEIKSRANAASNKYIKVMNRIILSE